MTDLPTRIRADIEKRLRELEPLVKEHRQLQDVLDKLADIVGPATRGAKSSSARPATAKNGRRRAGRSGRPRKGQPTRADQFLKVIQDNPGITVSEAAKRMGIAPNYLYRIRNDLQKQGKIKKQGKGLAAKSG